MKFALLVLFALPAGAALLLLAAFGVTTFHAGRTSDELCSWFEKSSAPLPASLPEMGPQTRGLLLGLRDECRDCTCRVTSGPHTESVYERAVVVSRGPREVLGLRVGLTRSFTPVVLGYWSPK